MVHLHRDRCENIIQSKEMILRYCNIESAFNLLAADNQQKIKNYVGKQCFCFKQHLNRFTKHQTLFEIYLFFRKKYVFK